MNTVFVKRFAAAALVLSLGGMLAACGGRKMYPDALPGWHSADYKTVFGRLQRVASKDPDSPPAWVIWYGTNDADSYAGKFNLMPPEKLAGYSGGELVEVHGSVRPQYVHPEFTGSWYQVDAIRLWENAVER